MVLGEAVAGAAVGAHSLWSYNRGNYLFDRKMRQEQEFKILGYRNQQAKLWRQDIRDIVGLTERKMDNYLIVSTLQLAMCVGLFTEGRLEPGTPPWLMHFYMLTLGSAFMYLTISVWLAVHASVVAQCSSVRLLTQFVRLPIPTWKQLESIRTYASSFESLKMVDMLRMPFMSGCNASSQDAVDSVVADYLHKSDISSSDSHVTHGVTGTSTKGGTVDPWGLEEDGASRSLYELQAKPAALRHHITLARRAAVQYQCYDGFARVAMTFGTNQLLNALTYYCLGYLSIQDGAPLPSACTLVIMMSIASTLLQLDFSLTKREQFLLLWFMIAGPSISCLAVVAYLMDNRTHILVVLLPLAYASHGMFLGLALKSCGIKVQPNGAALPMKLRSVLYLDVFGWLSDKGVETGSVDECKKGVQAPHKSSINAWACTEERARVCKLKEHLHQVTTADDAESSCVGGGVSCCENEQQEQIPGGSHEADFEVSTTWIHSQVRLSTSPKKAALPVIEEAVSSSNSETVGLLGNPSGEAANSAITTAMQAAQNFSCLFHDEDEVQYELLRSDSMDVKATTQDIVMPDMSKTGMPGPSTKFDPSGAVPVAPATAFEPASYVHKEDCKGSVHTEHIDEEVVTGHDRVRPGLLPSRIFRGATWLLIVSWTAGTGLPLSGRRDLWFEPQMKAELEELNKARKVRHHKSNDMWVNRERWYSNEPLIQEEAPIPLLSGVLMSVKWPFNHGFVPRSISCDPSGTQLAVADDIGIFTGQLGSPQSNPSLRRLQALDISFQRIPSCRALEGQALIDIGVICNLSSLRTCHVLVLHGTGRNISGCSIKANNHSVMNEENMTWKVSNGWLHNEYKNEHPEHILAAAMDRACLDGREDMKSCMVMGTSAGRIVQMREHLDDKHELVPERAMQRRRDEVKPGSLHIYHTSYGAGFVLYLQPRSHTIEAFTENSGKLMGKWQLPATVTWLTLCGGGDFLYVAGIRLGATEMYRFAIPDMLKSATPE